MAAVREAGAIAVRHDGRDVRVLLVTAKRHPEQWIFPKGHVEPGETVEAAAVRETLEEAGVDGTAAGRAGSLSYVFESETYIVEYFILTATAPGHPNEGRRSRWCTYDDAMQLLSFDDARRLLESAWPLVQSVTFPPSGSATGSSSR